MDPAEAARRFEKGADRLGPELVRATEAAIRHTLDMARMVSSGPHSTAALRRAGHPYARRGGPRVQAGSPGYPSGIINVQSGDFLAGWRRGGPFATSDGVTGHVFQSDWKGPLLQGGTTTMIARPAAEEAAEEAQDMWEDGVTAAVTSILEWMAEEGP